MKENIITFLVLLGCAIFSFLTVCVAVVVVGKIGLELSHKWVATIVTLFIVVPAVLNEYILRIKIRSVKKRGGHAFRNWHKLSIGFINLSSTKVTNDNLLLIGTNKGLMTLNLANTEVSNFGITHLKDCKWLSDLDISNTNVSNSGVGDIMVFKRLKVLDIRGTQITHLGLDALKGALPECCRILASPE